MKKIIILLALPFWVFSLNAATYCVHANNESTWSSEAVTALGAQVYNLQAAGKTLDQLIAVADVGSTFYLLAGQYTLNEGINRYRQPKIYGGFAGTETSISARNIGSKQWYITHPSIIDGNGSIPFCSEGNVMPSTLLDGLTIQNCKSTGNSFGINETGSISGCRFISNTSTGNGGAVTMYNGGTITGCYFESNSGGNGGAIFVSGSGTPSIIGCGFKSNNASTGGAIQSSCTGSLTINTCEFADNEASTNGSTFYFNSSNINNKPVGGIKKMTFRQK